MSLTLLFKQRSSGAFLILLYLVGLLLFCYIAARGVKLSFTHDESLSYTILTGNDKWVLTANNHWLNTILGYLSSKILGYTEVALRLPNMLAFIIYLVYSFKFLQRFSKHLWSAVFFVPFVLLNPFVLDFFSLFRGYGLATAFLMASLFHLTVALRKEKIKDLLLAVIFGLLSIYANYSFLMVILAALGSFFIIQLLKKLNLTFEHEAQPVPGQSNDLQATENRNQHRLSFLFNLPAGSGISSFFRLISLKEFLIYAGFGLAIIPAILNTLILSKRHELYFGGEEGVIKDTLFSIITASLYGSAFASFAGLILLLLAVCFIAGLFARKSIELWFYLVVVLLLIFIPVVLNAAMDMKFPIERSAIYWVVITGIFVLFLSESLLNSKNPILKWPVLGLLSLLSIGNIVNFGLNFGFKATHTWGYDANTREAVKTLAQQVDKSRSYKIGVNALFEPAVNYYREIYHYSWLEPIPRDDLKSGYDLYYIRENNFEILKQDCLREIKHFPDTESWLMEQCVADK